MTTVCRLAYGAATRGARMRGEQRDAFAQQRSKTTALGGVFGMHKAEALIQAQKELSLTPLKAPSAVTAARGVAAWA